MLVSLRREMEENVSNHLPHSGKQLIVLDYGCGNMPYRPLFEKLGALYVGADMPGNSLAEINIKSNGYVEYPSNACDVVVSTQVLEHVNDPTTYLAECYRLLRPGGRLILSTHGYWWYHPDPADYWRWTGQGLRRILRDAGFHLVRFRGVIGLAGAACQLFHDATFQRLPQLFRPLYALSAQAAITMLDHMCFQSSRDDDAMIYVAVAEKPNH